MPNYATKNGTVKPMEWVETIDRRGKACWVERPLKPPGRLREAHGTPRPSGTPRRSEKYQAGGAIGSTGEEFGVLMTIILAMVLLVKLR